MERDVKFVCNKQSIKTDAIPTELSRLQIDVAIMSILRFSVSGSRTSWHEVSILVFTEHSCPLPNIFMTDINVIHFTRVYITAYDQAIRN
jgi:hypothetical protein